MTVWRDFDNNFNKSNNGDVVIMEDYAAINNSLTNIFETFQGSRRMVPEFALAIYRLLFEPIDRHTAANIANLILGSIERWETRIKVTGLFIDAKPDNNRYDVTLEYRIVGTSDDSKLKTFNTVLRST